MNAKSERASLPTHPEHNVHMEHGGRWLPAPPILPTGLLGRRVRRACKKRGGHWWHPDPKSMTSWYCCVCGAEREGMPVDGT